MLNYCSSFYYFFVKRAFKVYLKREGDRDVGALLTVEVGFCCPLLGEKPVPR